ncbi:hypothetical protein QS257_18830 [Terrilactibacillus sp. S3-3]|nr:hypothetical protein QS257_18830 [Terrilactibacillus sp. S3-3]
MGRKSFKQIKKNLVKDLGDFTENIAQDVNDKIAVLNKRLYDELTGS